MRLSNYLRLSNMSSADFAKKIGITKSYISFIASGKKFPSINVAKKICEFTNNEVTLEDLAYPERDTQLTTDQIFEAVKEYKEKYLRNKLQINTDSD